jgi:nucleoid-associated protein YgaU
MGTGGSEPDGKGAGTVVDWQLFEPERSQKTMKYVVKSGDTLSKIAKELYGDGNRWREIFEANKDQIENPNLIRPGWELLIPGLDDEEEKEDKTRRAGSIPENAI